LESEDLGELLISGCQARHLGGSRPLVRELCRQALPKTRLLFSMVGESPVRVSDVAVAKDSFA
jgi:hypothetical protein